MRAELQQTENGRGWGRNGITKGKECGGREQEAGAGMEGQAIGKRWGAGSRGTGTNRQGGGRAPSTSQVAEGQTQEQGDKGHEGQAGGAKSRETRDEGLAPHPPLLLSLP